MLRVRVDSNTFEVGSTSFELPAAPRRVIERLASRVTEARLRRMESVVARRLLSVQAVMEELVDPHNMSAVMRSADAFGVQRVHAIAGEHGFLASPNVARGAQRWLDIMVHDDAEACVRRLRDEGMAIAVAAAGGEMRPDELAAHARVAVVFGNEHRGVSEGMRALADTTFEVPMVGFTESLNVSVAAAVTLYALSRGRHGELAEAEREALLARYLMLSVRNGEQIVRGQDGT